MFDIKKPQVVVRPDQGALVVTRKLGECVWIGKDVCIQYLEKRQGRGREIRLLVVAPRHVRISRTDPSQSE